MTESYLYVAEFAVFCANRAGAKKLFATTTTPKQIVCVDEMSIPPLQKNNGPSLSNRYLF
jgi:hypothetical protein